MVFSPKSSTRLISLILGFEFHIYIIYSHSFLTFAHIGWFYAYLYLLYFPYLLLHFELQSSEYDKDNGFDVEFDSEFRIAV